MKQSEKQIDRVDQFFKNKLEDHSIAPSENAWAKVEAGLSKKNNVVLWRWAAAVLLMGALITIIIYQSQKTENTQPAMAEKKNEEKKSDPTKQKKALTATTGVTKSAPAKKKSPPGAQQIKVLPEIQKEESVAKEDLNKKQVREDVNQEAIAVVKNKIEEKTKPEATAKREVASSQQKPIKLEFTLEDPSVETVATTSEEKTGLKKVLELAREIKQGEGPVNNWREKKNELFARNFINGKTKNE